MKRPITLKGKAGGAFVFKQVRISYEERHRGDWGGYKPKVVVEFDERNSYLMTVDVTYNRREADKNLGYNYRELKDKIQNELDSGKVIIACALGNGIPLLMVDGTPLLMANGTPLLTARRNATFLESSGDCPPLRVSRV